MAVFGVEHFLPGLQGEMVLARRSLRGWDNLRPPQSHPPLNMALTSSLAAEMSRMGHPGAGVATLLGFDCYLRISEIAALRVYNVADLGVLVPHTYGQMIFRVFFICKRMYSKLSYVSWQFTSFNKFQCRCHKQSIALFLYI